MSIQLRTVPFVVAIYMLALASCSGPTAVSTVIQENVPTSTLTATLTPEPTQTIIPSSTPHPTATQTGTPTQSPTPQGGGGKLVVTLFKSAYASEFNLEGDANLFVLNPDGSAMKPITNGPKGLVNLAMDAAPDGSRIAFTQTKLNPSYYYIENPLGDLFTIKPDGTGLTALTNAQRKAYRNGATWLADGRLLFFGMDAKGPTIFIGNADSGDVTRLQKPSGSLQGRSKVLALTSDQSAIYWVTGEWCNDRALCNEHYYFTKLDDSDQHAIWTMVKNAADSVQVSPDGKSIAFMEQFNNDQVPDWGCHIADIDGKTIVKLEGQRPSCHSIGLSRYSNWSPDGGQFIYEDYNPAAEKRFFRTWSAGTHQSDPLPDLHTAACDSLAWIDGGKQILFFNCQSNTWGISIPSAARILDPTSGQVKTLPDTGFCSMRLSPDKNQAFFYVCSQSTSDQPLTDWVISLTGPSTRHGFDLVKVPPKSGQVYNKEYSFSSYFGQAFWLPAE